MAGWREGKISDWTWWGEKGAKEGSSAGMGVQGQSSGCKREITG